MTFFFPLIVAEYGKLQFSISNGSKEKVVFTKENLPNGSIVWVNSGWQYRPEGWVDSETLNETRPENVTTKYILVTEEWWGNYTVRAFNISENPWVNQQFLLSTTEEEIKQIFKIYVPASAVENTFCSMYLHGPHHLV